MYTAGKASIRTLARAWAAELKDRRIRVNVLSPGGFDTGGMAELFPDENVRRQMFDQLAASTPAGRIGDPAEAAAAVLFLASDAASYLTGSDLQVDGGIGQV